MYWLEKHWMQDIFVCLWMNAKLIIVERSRFPDQIEFIKKKVNSCLLSLLCITIKITLI